MAASINCEIVDEKTTAGKGLVATRNLTKGSRIFNESPLLGIISEQYLPQQKLLQFPRPVEALLEAGCHSPSIHLALLALKSDNSSVTKLLASLTYVPPTKDRLADLEHCHIEVVMKATGKPEKVVRETIFKLPVISSG